MRDAARFFKFLADEARLKIIWLLFHQDELCVCDIMAVLDVTQSKASRHLRTLHNAGLVDVGPFLDLAAAFGGDGEDVAAQVWLCEAQFFRAHGRDADGEHGDVAAIVCHVVNQTGERAIFKTDCDA